jgi:hypothetical protein
MTRTIASWHAFRCLGMLGLLTFLWPVTPAMAQATPEPAQVILHLLDYVAVEYPQCVQDGTVLNQSEYNEQVNFPSRCARTSTNSQCTRPSPAY